MSLISSIMYHGMRLVGVKKMYTLPEDKFLEKVRKMNSSRGFYMPGDKKAVYKEKRISDRYQSLVVQNEDKISERAILFFLCII